MPSVRHALCYAPDRPTSHHAACQLAGPHRSELLDALLQGCGRVQRGRDGVQEERVQHAAPVLGVEHWAQVAHGAKVQHRALRLGGLALQPLAALLQQQRTRLTVCLQATSDTVRSARLARVPVVSTIRQKDQGAGVNCTAGRPGRQASKLASPG